MSTNEYLSWEIEWFYCQSMLTRSQSSMNGLSMLLIIYSPQNRQSAAKMVSISFLSCSRVDSPVTPFTEAASLCWLFGRPIDELIDCSWFFSFDSLRVSSKPAQNRSDEWVWRHWERRNVTSFRTLTQMLRHLMFQAIIVEFVSTWKHEEWLHQQVHITNGTFLLPIDDNWAISKCLQLIAYAFGRLRRLLHVLSLLLDFCIVFLRNVFHII